MSTPVVSVCIITYQHRRFIQRCVEAVLAQRTDFPIEILIGEDESTDGTREYCREMAAVHPDLIRLFLRSRRDVVYIDGRPRGGYNFRATLKEARGEFIAYVEGDDFWTDPEKLVRQVGYLRANPDCVGCFHESSLVDEEERVLEANFFRSHCASKQEKFDERGCLTELQSKYPSCSLCFRREALGELPPWYLRRPSDFSFDLVLTHQGGKLGYLNRNMAAYRRHAGGVWGGMTRVQQVLEPIIRFKLLLAEPYFLANYRSELLGLIEEFEKMLLTSDIIPAAEAEMQKQIRAAEANFAETHAKNAALLASLKSQIDRLLVDRERLLAFTERQHGMIKALEGRRSAASPA